MVSRGSRDNAHTLSQKAVSGGESWVGGWGWGCCQPASLFYLMLYFGLVAGVMMTMFERVRALKYFLFFVARAPDRVRDALAPSTLAAIEVPPPPPPRPPFEACLVVCLRHFLNIARSLCTARSCLARWSAHFPLRLIRLCDCTRA